MAPQEKARTCRKNNSPIVAILNDLKSNISRNSVGYAHITGENYRAFLKHFGATEEDLQLMESGSLHKDIQVDKEPKMFFRQVSQFTSAYFPSNTCYKNQ